MKKIRVLKDKSVKRKVKVITKKNFNKVSIYLKRKKW